MCTVSRFLFRGVQNVRVLRADVQIGRPVFLPPPPAGAVFCRKQRKKLQKKAPLPGADSPYQGEMSRRDKRGRDAGAKRLRGCCKFAATSPSRLRRATSPGRGGLGERTPMASPMRGSCRRRRLMRWGQLRRRRSVHLIRHGSAVPPSPRRGRHGAAPAQKKRPSRSGRALGQELIRYRGSCTYCGG